MRFLLALLLSANLGASVAAGTQALWKMENNFLDSSGNGYTLTGVGGVGFATSPVCQGSYSMGPLAIGGGQYAGETSLYTAMIGDNTWSVEGYVYFTTLIESAYVMYWGGQPLGFDYVAVYIHTLNRPALLVDDLIAVLDTSTITTGVCYYFAVVANGANSIKFYWSPASSISQTAVGESVVPGYGDWPSFAGGSITIGTNGHSPSTSFCADCSLDNERVSNVVITSFPTVDPPDERFKLKNDLKIDLGWLLYPFTWLATKAEARMADQWQETVAIDVTYLAKATPTRTPVAIPTATSTPTPTPVP